MRRLEPWRIAERLGGITGSTLAIIGVRITFLGLAFVTGVVLARVLGVQGFGHYSLAMAWTGFLAVLVTLGLPELITREVPARSTAGAWSRLRGLIVWSDAAIAWVASVVALLAAGVAWTFVSGRDAALAGALVLAFASLPFYGLLRSTTAVVQGLRYPLISQVPELLARPVAFLVLVLVFVGIRPDALSGAIATALFTASRAIALAVSYLLLARVRPAPLATARPVFEGRRWLRTALPFLAISSIFVVSANTDSIMLGFLRSAEEVGIYAVANQGAQLILMALMAAQVVVMPEVSRHFAAGNMVALQQVVRRSAVLATLVAVAISIVLISLGPLFLRLFGPGFAVGYGALILLSIAQLVNAVTGLAGPVLSMTGHERTTAAGFVVGAVTNVVLNAIFIPVAGVEGAAMATGISVVVQNVLMAYWVRRRLGVNSLPIGRTLRESP